MLSAHVRTTMTDGSDTEPAAAAATTTETTTATSPSQVPESDTQDMAGEAQPTTAASPKEEEQEEQKEEEEGHEQETPTEEAQEEETKEESKKEEEEQDVTQERQSTEGESPNTTSQSPTTPPAAPKEEQPESDAVAEEVSRALDEVPQIIRFLDEKDTEFAPMKTVYGALAARFAYCVAVLEALHTHFAARQTAAEAYQTAMAELPPLQADTLFKTESVLSGGLEYLKRVGWTERESFGQLAVILKDNCTEIAALTAQVAASRTAFTQTFAGLEKAAAEQLGVARTHCNAYTSILGRAKTQGTGLFQRDPAAAAKEQGQQQQGQQQQQQQAAADPWLVFGRYCSAVPDIDETVARMHEELLVGLNTVARYESRMFQLVHRTAQKFVAMQSNLLNKVLVDDKVAFDILGKMDEKTYQQQFATTAFEQLALPPTAAAGAAAGTTGSQNSGGRYSVATGSQYAPLAVACAGCLDVSGMLLWTRHDAVLTRFGFLHLYQHTDDFADSDVTSTLTPAMMDRVLHTPPTATLFLRGAKISVDQSAGACCLRVVEKVAPSSRGWFGTVHRSEHLFRVPSQQQLSRWIAEMHHFI